jgi:hypothetical protein
MNIFSFHTSFPLSEVPPDEENSAQYIGLCNVLTYMWHKSEIRTVASCYSAVHIYSVLLSFFCHSSILCFSFILLSPFTFSVLH